MIDRTQPGFLRTVKRDFAVWATVCSVLALVLVFITLESPLFSVSHSTHEPGKSPEYPRSVSEVAWTWELPRDSGPMAVREFGEGALVLLEGGVFALSGETGEELWSYYDNDKDLDVNVTDNGEYVVLYDEETFEITLLERDTGQVAHEYTFDLSRVTSSFRVRTDPLDGPLSGMTGETWVAPLKDSVASYALNSGNVMWEATDVANCSDEAWILSLSVQDEVVIAATTCYEQPEGDENDKAWTLGWDFTSELVGLDPESGEELWRVEHSIGDMPGESIQRDIASRPGGLVSIDYLDSPDLGHSLLDIKAREATHLGTRELLWSSPDGESLGLWDPERREYQVQDRSGEVERTVRPDLGSMSGDVLDDGYQVGLADGILHLEENVLDAPVDSGSPRSFARFDGFEGSSVITWDGSALPWDGEENMYVNSARSVPGAVAVSYSVDGDRGVMGLQ